MSKWWEINGGEHGESRFVATAVAYYRHSREDGQQNSIPIQQEQVRQWAEEHGVEIIHEFSDPGRSGLTAEGRPAFTDMMENWVKGQRNFQYVLCLDVSRWGRFQDIDLSAQYSAECKRHGRQVIYTTIGMPREDDPLYPVYVQFERFRAAQYSRELSDKVLGGCRKVAEQGYSPGASAPYGLDRLLLDEQREPVQVLQQGQRKSISNQRVTLAPGDEFKASVVIRIFEELTDHKSTLQQIADGLNRDGIPSPGGRKWDACKVKRIATNEKYAGTMTYNRTTQKLKTPRRSNPEEKWVNSPDAFEGLISQDMYQRTLDLLSAASRLYDSESMLHQLESVFQEHGLIRNSLLRVAEGTPSPSTYAKRFGSLDVAFQRLFQEIHGAVRQRVHEQIQGLVDHVEVYQDFLVINERFSVVVQPSIPMPYGLTNYWFFQLDRRDVVDITLGVPVSGHDDHSILGYFVLPRLLTSQKAFRVYSASASRVEMYGHNGLNFIEQLAK